MSPKDICFIACYDSPMGASSRTWEFCKSLLDKGHKVTLITSNYNHFMLQKHKISRIFYDEEVIEGVKVVWVNSLNFKRNQFLRFFHMIFYSISSFFISLIYLNKGIVALGTSVPSPISLFSLLAARIKGSKYIFEIRDVWPEELIDLGVINRNGIPSIILRFIEVILYKNSDHIISALPNVKEHLKKIDEDLSFSYIPNPIDSTLKFTEYLGGKTKELDILYLGGSGKAQNIETIIDAFYLLPHESNIRISFVGPYERVKRYLDIINKAPDKNFKLYDKVPKKEISLHINKADLLIKSLKDNNQVKFGINSNKLIEYCSSGRMVLLAARVENDPVSISGCGYKITPEDPHLMAEYFLKALKMDPKERKIIGSRGKEHIASNSIEILSKKFSKIINEI